MGFGSYMDGKGGYPWRTPTLRRMTPHQRAHAAKAGRISWKQYRSFQGKIYRQAATDFAMSAIASPELKKSMLGLEEKVRAKVIQRAIKPLCAMVRRRWRSEIKAARTSGQATAFRRAYGGVGLRAALAKSIKTKLPSGAGRNTLRAYVSLSGGTTKHGKRGEAVTNAAQMLWLEYGTEAHDLKKGSKRAKGIQLGGGGHPGTRPMTNVRRAMAKMRPRAKVFFANAIADGIRAATSGKPMKALKAADAVALYRRGNRAA